MEHVFYISLWVVGLHLSSLFKVEFEEGKHMEECFQGIIGTDIIKSTFQKSPFRIKSGILIPFINNQPHLVQACPFPK